MRVTCCRTDEAASLALQALVPILGPFLRASGIEIELVDVSLAARALAAFHDELPPAARVDDGLGRLAQLVSDPSAVVVKPPGISATRAQLAAALAELADAGLRLPPVPCEPRTARERALRDRQDALLGSAVNIALRQGSSVRRVAPFVKRHLAGLAARPAAPEPADGRRSRVLSMPEGDFRASELAATLPRATRLRVEWTGEGGAVRTLHDGVAVGPGDVADASVMRSAALARFLGGALETCRREGLLFALPLKCTSMRVTDPAIFRAAMHAHGGDLLDRHRAVLDRAGVLAGDGLLNLSRLASTVADGGALLLDLEALRRRGPALAMDPSCPGRTTLDAPGGTSVAAFMASAWRRGGRCLDATGVPRATLFAMPDRAESDFHRVVIEAAQGAVPPAPAGPGSTTVVGLSADAADDYGAQDTTFEITQAGRVRVLDDDGGVLFEHAVAAGDLWRLRRRTRRAIHHWIDRALAAGDESGSPVVFWLDASRPRDRETLAHLRDACPVAGWRARGIEVKDVASATRDLLRRQRGGEPVVVATGNVLRDHLGDWVGAAEAGASAWLEVRTDLVGGGVLFEAGASGCGPRLFDDFRRDGHLRWNPLGDLVAWRAALGHLGAVRGHPGAARLGQGLEAAITALLDQRLMPARNAAGPDLRHTMFHLARLWARAMSPDPGHGDAYACMAQRLETQGDRILAAIAAVHGRPSDPGGRHRLDPARVDSLMHPGGVLGEILRGHPAPASAGTPACA